MKSFLLPSEQPLYGQQRQASLRRNVPTLLALLTLPVIGYFWQGIFNHVWGGSVIALLIATGFCTSGWQAVFTRHVLTNAGNFPRHTRPFLFWLHVVAIFAVYLVMSVLLFFPQPFDHPITSR